MRIVPLFPGFPGRADRGFLGWSSCALVFGDSGVLLFDTLGYNERAELLAALRAKGVTPGEVKAVFLSHFHFDHAVNYRLFPAATIYLHELELDYARSEYDRDLAVPVELLAHLEASGRLELLRGAQGSVEGCDWLHTPGHTAGLCSLLVEEPGGTTVLASDAVKNVGELLTGESAMAWNGEVARRSIAALRSRARRLLPGHDAAVTVLREGEAPLPGDLQVGALRLRQEPAAGVTITLAPGVPGSRRRWLVGPGEPGAD